MAEIVALSGQSFREVWDGMTWSDFLRLNAFWKRWPPLPISTAILAGIAPQQRDEAPQGGENTMESLGSLIDSVGQTMKA